MSTIICLCGKTSSGKSTIFNKISNDNKIKRVIRDTTRPARSNEVDGVDYNFITEKKFIYTKGESKYIETERFKVANGDIWRYGTPIKYANGDGIYITQCSSTSLRGIIDFNLNTENKIHIIPIYIKCDEKTRIEMMINREFNQSVPNLKEMFRRSYTDELDYEQIELIDGIHIVHNNFNLEETIKSIYDIIDEELRRL